MTRRDQADQAMSLDELSQIPSTSDITATLQQFRILETNEIALISPLSISGSNELGRSEREPLQLYHFV